MNRKYQKTYKLVEGYPFIQVESGMLKQFLFLKDKRFKFWDTFGLDYPKVFEKITKATPRYELLLRRIDRVKRKKGRKKPKIERETW